MSDLIDTTEMYLRTVIELMEEGIEPLRARIAERLSLASPTVSQTVARMERDGLLTLTDRRIELSEQGLAQGRRVMRRHRIAEVFLVQQLGLPLERAHDEACRWEHVMTDDVERRLVALLGEPRESPYGNPIPALAELGVDGREERFLDGVRTLASAAAAGLPRVVLRRVGEAPQRDPALLADLVAAGAVPGAELALAAERGGMITLRSAVGEVAIGPDVAADLFVASR